MSSSITIGRPEVSTPDGLAEIEPLTAPNMAGPLKYTKVRKFNKNWQGYQLSTMNTINRRNEKMRQHEAAERRTNFLLKYAASQNDGAKIVQLLLTGLQKREWDEKLVITDGYLRLGNMFEANLATPNPPDLTQLYVSTLNLLNYPSAIDGHNLAAGMLFLWMKVEKWVEQNPSRTPEMQADMQALAKKFSRKLGFLRLSKVNAPFSLTQRAAMRKRIQQLTGQSDEPKIMLPQNDYDLSLSLVDTLREPVRAVEYSGNPFKARGFNEKNHKRLFRKQLSAVKETWTDMPNPCYEPVASLVHVIGAENMAAMIHKSISCILAQGSAVVMRHSFQRTIIEPLVMKFQRMCLESVSPEDDEVFAKLFADYSRYFFEKSLPYTWFSMDVYQEISIQLETLIFKIFSFTEPAKTQNRYPVEKPVFSIKNISQETEAAKEGYVNAAVIVPAIKIAPEFMETLMTHRFERLSFPSTELPMVVPPRPWNDYGIGGPQYQSSSRVIRNASEFPDFKSNQECRQRLTQRQQARPVWDALNFLGSTPWKINVPLLDLLLKVSKMGERAEHRALMKQLNIPMCPMTIERNQVTIKALFGDYPGYVDMTKENWTEFRRQKYLLFKERNEAHSLRSYLLYRLAQANYFRMDTLYFPHNMDFRGRVYPISPHLSHMGDDVNRSLLIFARGRPLGTNGLHWLKRHVINLTGLYKKKSVEERDRIADELLPKILASAENPLDCEGQWWKESEAPFQTLAACIEIKKAIDSGNPEKFISHLPIHQDGSCNGLQHYAALGRDKEGAAEVNLLPADIPGDVYSSVAKRVELRRLHDENEVSPSAHKVARELREAMPQEVPRKVIKQTVMTTVYGVTMRGAEMQILKQLKALELPGDLKAFARYLADLTFKSLNDAFKNSMELKEWFRQCAKGIAQLHRTVEWVTPLGLPVAQPYVKMETHRGIRFPRPIATKQMSAFPPNYVHSIDSTHMMLTALECARRGLTFAAVHDCYWTHASSVEEMNHLCRETFIRLHSEPLGLLTPRVPPGTLDLSEVRNSVYFFS
ncbi:unnamed protein product, partial [Mesorhabditis spiculigera]